MKLHVIGVHLVGATLLFSSCISSADQTHSAQETATDNAKNGQSIEITGVRNPEWKPYRTLLLGFDAFERHRELAPKAALRFSVRSLNPATSIDGVTMSLESRAHSIPLQLDQNSSFSLPLDQAAVDDGAELLINRKKNTITIRPDIRTPGLPANMRRLGDLRLECHVRWAIQRDELSFVKRNAFRMLGGPCASGTVKTFYIADRMISGAWITLPGRKVPLEVIGNGTLFRPPLHETAWSDEALIELEFDNEIRSPDKGEDASLAESKHENANR
ncbi:hypothetical protein [Massilia sp. H6]|uniref:hypothetical protein n=1 Tax=Massilia sp. H6 TaxID=2970464 RepID=UPI0021683263|nr:hypothetical protein [Massilia sp. H6]UVW29023.1 hypothetical protein NRS07_02455 [Massilia sp. H6]